MARFRAPHTLFHSLAIAEFPSSRSYQVPCVFEGQCSDKDWRVRRSVFKVIMPENERFNGGIDQINLEFVEREAKPRFLRKLNTQLHLAGLSLSNTVFILEVFGVQRLVQLFTTGFTRSICSPKLGEAWITLQSTKLCSDLTIKSIG